MADKVFRNYSFSDIHNHNYILQELLDYKNELQAENKKLKLLYMKFLHSDWHDDSVVQEFIEEVEQALK